MKKYLDLAANEKIVIQRGRNETFVLTREDILEPDEDLKRAITAKELWMGSAVQYVRDLIFAIEDTLPVRMHKAAPSYFDRYGRNMQYAVFRKNAHTQWYVFFNTYRVDDEAVFLVRYISNNHMIAQYL